MSLLRTLEIKLPQNDFMKFNYACTFLIINFMIIIIILVKNKKDNYESNKWDKGYVA